MKLLVNLDVLNNFWKLMKKLHFSFLFIFGFIVAVTAQDKQIPLEEIWNGEFRTEGMDVLRSMNSGTEYTVL